MLDQSFYQKADEIIAFYGKKPASLIPIMQDIQGVYRYLPEELLTYVAEQIGVTEAKAFSVATFYERVWENENEVAKYLHKQVNNFLNGKINVNQIKCLPLKLDSTIFLTSFNPEL